MRYQTISKQMQSIMHERNFMGCAALVCILTLQNQFILIIKNLSQLLPKF
jgi:hypothetical protein